MSKLISWVPKAVFSFLSIAAIFYMIGLSNVLCGGPIYQPRLPEEANRFKKHL